MILSLLLLSVCVTYIQASGVVCPADVKLCKDQITFVSRNPNKNCKFMKCPPCIRRKFDFNNMDHFLFTINDKDGGNVNKALKGSGKRYRGKMGEPLYMGLKYSFAQVDQLDNRGFRGEICFKVRGADSIVADYAGIPSTSCDDDGNCSGTGGGVAIGELRAVDPKVFTEHCEKAQGNSFVGFDLVSGGGRIMVKSFYFKGCEVST